MLFGVRQPEFVLSHKQTPQRVLKILGIVGEFLRSTVKLNGLLASRSEIKGLTGKEISARDVLIFGSQPTRKFLCDRRGVGELTLADQDLDSRENGARGADRCRAAFVKPPLQRLDSTRREHVRGGVNEDFHGEIRLLHLECEVKRVFPAFGFAGIRNCPPRELKISLRSGCFQPLPQERAQQRMEAKLLARRV